MNQNAFEKNSGAESPEATLTKIQEEIAALDELIVRAETAIADESIQSGIRNTHMTVLSSMRKEKTELLLKEMRAQDALKESVVPQRPVTEESTEGPFKWSEPGYRGGKEQRR